MLIQSNYWSFWIKNIHTGKLEKCEKTGDGIIFEMVKFSPTSLSNYIINSVLIKNRQNMLKMVSHLTHAM